MTLGLSMVGSTSATQSFEIRSAGTEDLLVTGISIGGTNAGEFSLVSPPGTPFTLTPGATQNVDAQFNPTSTGLKTATLLTDSNDPDEPQVSVPLVGSVSEDVTAMSQFGRSSIRYNRRTGQFSLQMTWTNTGSDTFTAPLQMVISSITPPPPTVTVANADGITPGGDPFFDFSALYRTTNLIAHTRDGVMSFLCYACINYHRFRGNDLGFTR